MLFGLFYNHVRFCMKNISTLDYMGLRQTQYDFSTLTNLKMVFNSAFYFFVPIAREDPFEGYYFPRVMQDPEFIANSSTVQKEPPKIYSSKEQFLEEFGRDLERGLGTKEDKDSWKDSDTTTLVFNDVEIVGEEVKIKNVN